MENFQCSTQLSKLAKIVIDNEDSSYKALVKILNKFNLIGSNIQKLRCKQAPRQHTLTNKFKKIDIDFQAFEGLYEFQFQGDSYKIVFERGVPLILTQCRKLQYEKKLTIYGQQISKIKKFVEYCFDLLDQTQGIDTITIYENNQGYWNVSKQKKPRKMESVIFKQDFVKNVLSDIEDFIDSQQWYSQMGIPYKRSYLLYGPPGTGKSSFAQAIAAHIQFSICFVNVSDRMNDFNFNNLLNTAPQQSIILIEDVDSIFSQRKNTQKNNALTFSGFLNAIDGVRSQEGRIIIMTTNYKDRLDPALLRPGRVDEMFEIGYANSYQIQTLCFRFFKKQQLAKQFSQKLPENKLSMSQIQGYLLKYRRQPQKIIEKIDELLNSDENVPIGQFLSQINCLQCTNQFKIQQCYTLANAKNLPKDILNKITSKLSNVQKERLIEAVRLDRKKYIKSPQAIQKFIQETIHDEFVQRKILKSHKQNQIKTFYTVRDLAKKFAQQTTNESLAKPQITQK